MFCEDCKDRGWQIASIKVQSSTSVGRETINICVPCHCIALEEEEKEMEERAKNDALDFAIDEGEE